MQAAAWKSRIPSLVLAAVLCLAPRVPHAAPPGLVTDFERSGGKQSPDYAATADYLRRLDAASPWVRVESFGKSPEGRDLQVVIVDRHGAFTPAKAHSGDNVVVLVQAGIHSGEIDGKDAGLMLIRAMAVDKTLQGLLHHVTLLFIPIYNVDGHERRSAYNRPNQNGPEIQGFRATAQNLNLNRDYLKADAPETRAWLSLFNKWEPDVLIDCHVTDGANYQYVVTYSFEVWASTDSAVARWTSDRWLRPLSARMSAAGLPLAPYCNFRRDNDPQSGIKSGPATPRFSTGYAALRDRPALLIETHMLKDYATRVHGTYEMLHHSLAVIGDDHAALRRVIADADARAAALDKQELPVSFEVDYSDSVMMDFLGVDYYEDTSDITGGTWVHFSNTPRTMRIPYFAKQRVTAAAMVPAAYIIPVQWTVVIDRLTAHGIRFTRLDRAVTMDVATYRFSNAKWEAEPFESHHSATYDLTPVTEKLTFAPGSVVVDTAQPLGRVIVNLLEPAAPDALVRWGYMDSVFEQKEYFENYALEGVIRKMLADSPALAAEFKTARADTALANHPDKIRRWFYERSPWYEKSAGLYPIGRILDRSVMKTLPVHQGRS
jgi:hypothetical protein